MGKEFGDLSEPVMRLMGTISAEECDVHEAERLEELLSRPIAINRLNAEKLLESGLFSQYQVASIVDYREEHGNIMSVMELSAIDGIGPHFASLIAPFLSLDDDLDLRRDVYCCQIKSKFGLKCLYDGTFRWSTGQMVSSGLGRNITVGVSFAKTFSGMLVPEAIAGNFTFHLPNSHFKIVVGDYNARFGQGLALWTGMGMNGISAPSSFSKKSSGITASTSFSSDYSFTGAAAQYTNRRLRLVAALSLPGLRAITKNKEKFGLMPLFDISSFMSNGQISLTGYMIFLPFARQYAQSSLPIGKSNSRSLQTSIADAKISLSQRWMLSGSELFAEFSYDWLNNMPAALVGVIFVPFEALRLAGAMRYYPLLYNPTYSAAMRSRSRCSNEHSLSLTGEFSLGKYLAYNKSDIYAMPTKRCTGTFHLDVSHIPLPSSKVNGPGLQIKSGLNMQLLLNEIVAFRLKLTERFRTWSERFRTEAKTDLILSLKKYHAALRLNLTSCNGLGFLGYLEGGFKDEVFSLYLRTGAFCIDNWADRIYVYERDAPGTFNVPAFYGRGLWAAVTASCKIARWGRIYARLASISYPFAQIQKKKPGNAELKLQMNIKF